jgi:hypothetical protein
MFEDEEGIFKYGGERQFIESPLVGRDVKDKPMLEERCAAILCPLLKYAIGLSCATRDWKRSITSIYLKRRRQRRCYPRGILETIYLQATNFHHHTTFQISPRRPPH